MGQCHHTLRLNKHGFHREICSTIALTQLLSSKFSIRWQVDSTEILVGFPSISIAIELASYIAVVNTNFNPVEISRNSHGPLYCYHWRW